MNRPLLCIILLALLLSPLSAAAIGAGPLFPAASGGVAKFIVLSEKTGEEKFHVNETKKQLAQNPIPPKIERKAVKYSPLAWYLPEKWVPVVASAIGAFLISTLHHVLTLGQSYMETIVSDKKKVKLKIKPQALRVFGVKVREIISVMAAAFILGAAITWTYTGPTLDFVWLMGVNTVICLLAGISHELVHKLTGKVLGIKSEYTFWPVGSLMTLVSAFLGNAFGLQGLLLEQVDPNEPRWKIGLMKLSAPMFSLVIMLCSSLLNLLYPTFIFQMVGSIAGMVSMAEILPFKPMDGYDVRRWNILIWLGAFIIIFVSFSLVSFVL